MSSESWEILTGDCRAILDTLPERSVQCVVTSPPYWGQRDYGVDGMIGLEADVETWVAVMVDVFRKVWRVLRDDGTLWINLGDKYAGSGGAGGDYRPGGLKDGVQGGPVASPVRHKFHETSDAGRRERKLLEMDGLKAKDLMGLPWRAAFALQANGWYLRRDIIWHKPNPMPESATDRPATAHEYVFLLTKKPRYFYDAAGVREDGPTYTRKAGGYTRDHQINANGSKPFQGKGGFADSDVTTVGRSLRSVWTISTQSFSGPHYATFPEKLVEPCIKAGSAPGDLVLDPFSGAGTTGLVAARFGRRYIGIELNPEYAEMSRKRIADSIGATSVETADELGVPVQGLMFT